MPDLHVPALPVLTWHPVRCVWVVKTTDRFHVDVIPLLFTFALVLTPRDQDDHYVDRWCYHSLDAAVAAAVAYDADQWPDLEPTGWHRHPTSGRRRPDGDPSREHVHH